MEYFLECRVVDRDINLIRPIDDLESSFFIKSDSNSNSNSNSNNLRGGESKINEQKGGVRTQLKSISAAHSNSDTSVSVSASVDVISSDEPVYVKMFVQSSSGAGEVVIQVHKKWAPLGSERFIELVNDKFFYDQKFFRVIPKFMAQFGIDGDPASHRLFSKKVIKDDPFFKA